MTTPERLRARQRIQTALVLVTIVLSAGSVIVLDRRNADQDRCVAQQITDLTQALNARSELTQRQTEASSDVIDSFARAAAEGGESDTASIIKALENYTKVKSDVAALRKNTPFPPFPSGKCD